MPQVTITQWLEVPSGTRLKITRLFSLPKSGVVEMQFLNGKHEMKSDGHTHADLALLTIDRMNTVLEQLGSRIASPDVVDVFRGLVTALENPALETLEEAEEKLEPKPEAKAEVKPEGKPCCGSKGARHKKGCAEARVKA